MEQKFRALVEHVFGSWTGLQLAVAHGMATNGRDGRQVALECVDDIVSYCLNMKDIAVEDIEDTLEDLMEDNFDTLFEDDSPKEIAQVFCRMLTLLQNGNVEQFEVEYKSLPNRNVAWLSQPAAQEVLESQHPVAGTANVTENVAVAEVPMEQEDPEWTQVTSRRRR